MPHPELTDAMRAFLGHVQAERLLWDIVQEFMVRFELKPEDAGRLLAQWVRECC